MEFAIPVQHSGTRDCLAIWSAAVSFLSERGETQMLFATVAFPALRKVTFRGLSLGSQLVLCGSLS